MKKYWEIFKANYQVNYSYRAAVVIQTVRELVITGLFIFLWQVLFRSNNSIGGYTFKSIVVYYILVRVFDRFYTFMPARFLSRHIRTGDLSNYLVKPLNYFRYMAAFSFGYRSAVSTVTVLIALCLFLFFPSVISYPPNLIYSLSFVGFAILSWVLFYEIAFLFGITSFWTTEIGNIRIAVDQLILLLGGLWIPLNMFPQEVVKVLDYLPFKYLFYYLVQVYQGKIAYPQLVRNFFIELFWIGLFWLGIQLFWKKGVQRYENFGR